MNVLRSILDLTPEFEQCGSYRDGQWSVTTDGNEWQVEFWERDDFGSPVKFTDSYDTAEEAVAALEKLGAEA